MAGRAITEAKLAASAVGASQLADGTVTSEPLANPVQFGNPTNPHRSYRVWVTFP